MLRTVLIFTLVLYLAQFSLAQGQDKANTTGSVQGSTPTQAANHPDTVSGVAQEKPSRTYGKANKDPIKCFVVLLRLRYDLYGKWKGTGKWPDDKEANQALSGHGSYWNEQLKKGRVILTGGMDGEYWDNAALIIFEAESEKEGKEIVANDPAVKAYVFQAQVRPFNVLSLTNKFADK